MSLDEKTQTQALSRTQTSRRLRPGLPARQAHDYRRMNRRKSGPVACAVHSPMTRPLATSRASRAADKLINPLHGTISGESSSARPFTGQGTMQPGPRGVAEVLKERRPH